MKVSRTKQVQSFFTNVILQRYSLRSLIPLPNKCCKYVQYVNYTERTPPTSKKAHLFTSCQSKQKSVSYKLYRCWPVDAIYHWNMPNNLSQLSSACSLCRSQCHRYSACCMSSFTFGQVLNIYNIFHMVLNFMDLNLRHKCFYVILYNS